MDKRETFLGDQAARLIDALGDAVIDRGDLEDRVRAAMGPLVDSVRDQVALEFKQFITMDPVTSVLTEAAIDEAAETEFSRAVRYKRSLSALMLEVDGFAGIHVDQGPWDADAFLRTVILDCCRGIRVCDLVGRAGPAVFTILLPETGLEGAARVGVRLAEIMRETPIPAGEDAVSYTISVGVATSAREDQGATLLLERAKEALRRASEIGPDGIIVAQQASLEEETLLDEEGPDTDFNKALGNVAVEYLTPEEL